MQKLKKFIITNQKVLITIVVFLSFFILYRIVPMMYDGWAGKFYYNNINGIVDFVIYVLTGFYQWINGRITSNIVCGILESFKSEIILDLFNAGVIIGIFICIVKIIKNKKKYTKGILLYSSIVLLVSSAMRNEVLFYANTAYTVPILLVLLYYIFYNKLLNEESDLKNIIALSIISFTICTWMEHMAVGFLLTMSLICLINFIVVKNPKKMKLLIPEFSGIIGVIIMFLSPGLRVSRTIISEVSMIEIIKNNYLVFYRDIISNNIFLFFLLFFILFIYLLSNKQKNLKLRIPLLISSGFITICTFLKVINNILKLEKIEIITNKIFNNAIILDNFYICVLLGLIMILTLIGVAFTLKNKMLIFYLLIFCLCSIGPMLITPNVAQRVSFVGFIIMACITIIIYLEIPNYKTLNIVVIAMIIISYDKTILLGRRIYETTKKRNDIINEVIKKQDLLNWNYNDIVLLPKYSNEDVLYNGVTMYGDFHYSQFLQSSGLNPNTLVMFGDEGGALARKVDENIVTKVVYKNANENTEYMYNIKYSNESYSLVKDIENTGYIKDDSYIYEYTNDGYYIIEISVKNDEILNNYSYNLKIGN